MDHFANLIKKIRGICTPEELASLVNEILSSKRPLVLSFLNAHAITLAQKNDDFYHSLMASDILLRDGVGAAIAMKTLGYQAGMNMNGTDFIPLLLSSTNTAARMGVYGTQSPWLDLAAEKLAIRHHVISMCDGFQPDQHYIKLYKENHPEIILLGMGMPKQERIAIQLRACASDNTLIINGGAILDFMSSRVKRAPQWMRYCRMEWMFRLFNEPRRLLHRYTIGIAVFFYYLLRCRLRK